MTIYRRPPAAVPLTVHRARLLDTLHRIQINRAKLDDWHETTVANLIAVEQQIAAQRPIVPSMQELRDAVAGRFDGVDVVAYVEEVRGE